jgi:signal transduction histidine kinase
VRTLSYLLHPPLLDELGLAGAVRDFVGGFTQRSGIAVELELSSRLKRLPGEIELALFRVLQESLLNVHRHSGSKTASIRLSQSAGEIRLEVQDAGRGISTPAGGAAERGPTNALGVGISGMSERMRQLGGRLEIDSASGRTIVRAIVPLPGGAA